jgi:lipoprotein-releasing system ATP-binding protein
MSEVVLRLADLRRTYQTGAGKIDVLRGVELAIAAGECVALLGPSGSGKSTLLHAAGLLEQPDDGVVVVGGQDAARMDDDQRTALRLKALGFVYQFHHLLPEFTAEENVMMPQLIAGVRRGKARERARHLLTSLGLGHRLDHRPARMSGGEQQRTAIARALANHPRVLLADEPTGNLDGATSDVVFAELLRLVREERVGALIATHNIELAKRMDRIVTLQDGVLVTV